tara:strand:- start:187114 stop:188361 length:1248 start_codon:yes stop_codon:yes gene_type:complete
MFKPLSLYIGLRYTRAKRSNGFISFISLMSMLGIALGVAVLITVLSVMNGFDINIKQRVFSLAPQVTVNGIGGNLQSWQTIEKKLLTVPHVQAAAPMVQGQGLMRFMGSVAPGMVMGIVPKQEAKINELSTLMISGKLSDLKPGKFGIVLGETMADNLGIMPGNKVMVIVPKLNVTPLGISPQFKRFTVVGIFHAGNGFGFDNRLAYINMQDAQKLYALGSHINGINLKLSNPYLAPMVTQSVQKILPDTYVSDWSQQFGAFFNAVQLEKTMMFLILMLIIAVAAFNLVSTLVMAVQDKQADIAILRTLGATPRTIMMTFMVQGCVVGLIGIVLGLIGGVLLALNVTSLVTWLQNTFHLQLFSSSVYFLDYLPSKLNPTDVWHICIVAFILSLLATIYPAWKASRVQPAEALRYE